MPISSINLVEYPTLEQIALRVNKWAIDQYAKYHISISDYTAYINHYQLREDKNFVIETSIGPIEVISHSYVPINTILIIKKFIYPPVYPPSPYITEEIKL